MKKTYIVPAMKLEDVVLGGLVMDSLSGGLGVIGDVAESPMRHDTPDTSFEWTEIDEEVGILNRFL